MGMYPSAGIYYGYYLDRYHEEFFEEFESLLYEYGALDYMSLGWESSDAGYLIGHNVLRDRGGDGGVLDPNAMLKMKEECDFTVLDALIKKHIPGFNQTPEFHLGCNVG